MEYKDNIDKYIEDERKKRKKVKLTIVTIFVLSLLFAGFLSNFVFLSGVVWSESMENTLMVNDRFIGNRLSYKFGRTPQRYDVVVFQSPDNNHKLMVKRVIGIEGDEVEIKDGDLIINGVVIDEPYVKEEMLGHFGPCTVPEGSYLLLGDNRNRSSDARTWQNTFVTIDNIRAKASFVFYPKRKTIT